MLLNGGSEAQSLLVVVVLSPLWLPANLKQHQSVGSDYPHDVSTIRIQVGHSSTSAHQAYDWLNRLSCQTGSGWVLQ